MFSRILVPLDGSRFAEHAIPHAASIARRTGATLELVNVYQPPFSGTHVRGVRMFDEAQSRDDREVHRRYLSTIAERIAATHGVHCEVVVESGTVHERLLARAPVDARALFVMTTHGSGTPVPTWLGSVTERMVRESPIPVLLVHPDAETSAIDADVVPTRMLVPCDGSPAAARAVRLAGDVARFMGSEVVLFTAVLDAAFPFPAAERERTHVLSAAEEDAAAHLETLADAQRAEGIDVRIVVGRHRHAATAIQEAAAQEGADLIVLAAHGVGGMRRLMLGSVSDKVLRSSRLPMLVVGPGCD